LKRTRRPVEKGRVGLTSFLRRPLGAALVTLALALPAFALLKGHATTHYPVSHADAVKIARANPEVARTLGRYGYTSVRVSPIDKREQRVSFFRGSRLVLHAAVGSKRRVTHVAIRNPGSPQS